MEETDTIAFQMKQLGHFRRRGHKLFFLPLEILGVGQVIASQRGNKITPVWPEM